MNINSIKFNDSSSYSLKAFRQLDISLLATEKTAYDVKYVLKQYQNKYQQLHSKAKNSLMFSMSCV